MKNICINQELKFVEKLIKNDINAEKTISGLYKYIFKSKGKKIRARLSLISSSIKKHKDRYSCEISTTLNLGGDNWPIYLDPTGREKQAGIKIELKPGDMLIYSGCDLEHWREEFNGDDCGQVFLHYNKSSSKTAKENYLDKRP